MQKSRVLFFKYIHNTVFKITFSIRSTLWFISQKKLNIMNRTCLTFFCSLLLALSSVEKTASLSIECSFLEASYWSTFDKPYACVVYELRAAENVKETITNVTTGASGQLGEGLTFNDVIVLDLRGFCNIIPTGFDTFFPNLLGFSVYKTKLYTVSSDNLKQFPKLRELWIYSNALEYLPSNLFEHNSDIEYIHFHGNQIKFVGSDFFSKVPKLYGASFRGNVCIDRDAGDAKKIESLKKEIKKKCSSAASSENTHKATSLKISYLLYKISKLENEIMELKEQSNKAKQVN